MGMQQFHSKDKDDAIFVSLKHLVYLLCRPCVLDVWTKVIMLCVFLT